MYEKKVLRCVLYDTTGLQPVSSPVEQVNYFGARVEGKKSLWCQGFADRQPYMTGAIVRCIIILSPPANTLSHEVITYKYLINGGILELT